MSIEDIHMYLLLGNVSATGINIHMGNYGWAALSALAAINLMLNH